MNPFFERKNTLITFSTNSWMGKGVVWASVNVCSKFWDPCLGAYLAKARCESNVSQILAPSVVQCSPWRRRCHSSPPRRCLNVSPPPSRTPTRRRFGNPRVECWVCLLICRFVWDWDWPDSEWPMLFASGAVLGWTMLLSFSKMFLLSEAFLVTLLFRASFHLLCPRSVHFLSRKKIYGNVTNTWK